MSILVTGGAGYIGSHTVAELVQKNEDVIIVDSLEHGNRNSLLGGKLVIGDLRDSSFVNHIFKQHDIEAVIHFAAYIEVGESVKNPLKYYNNNVALTLNLLQAMKDHNVNKIVFSSTAATYGEPKNIPILEEDATVPTNPYGETKLAVEKALRWSEQAYGIKYVILRYFNASGAHKSGLIGEAHTPETHLIPLIAQTLLGQRELIQIFGDDYPTKDGTCIRDYIHVTDLANAHLLALDKLRKDTKSQILNLGNGVGFSVKEVIDIMEQVTGKKVPRIISPRRPGDPAFLIASSEKAHTLLGWKPQYHGLVEIIDTAWNWHKNHPSGFN